MAELSDLLQKQEQKREAREASKERVRIARTGPTRPWQHGLPRYQEKETNLPPEEDVPSHFAGRRKAFVGPESEDGNGREQTIALSDRRSKRKQKAKTHAVSHPLAAPDAHGHLSSPITENRKGGQTTIQQGTNGDNKRGQTLLKGGQSLQEQGTNGDNKRGQDQQKEDANGDNKRRRGSQQTGANGDKCEKAASLTGTNMFCPPKTIELSPVKASDNGDPKRVVPGLSPPCLPLQSGTERNPNRGQIPTSPQELALLFCLVKEVLKTGLGVTAVLKNDDLAEMANIKISGFKRVRTRLFASGHATRAMAGKGRSKNAGCVYNVSEDAMIAFKLKGGQQTVATGDNNGGQTDSSSRSLKNETTTKAQGQKALLERFELLLARIRMPDHFQVDSTDIAGWWRKVQVTLEMADDALEDFEDSFERWAFKLSSAKFSESSNPKAILAASVLSGLCGKVPGFVSWRDRVNQELDEIRRERAQKARQRHLAEYADNFEIWFQEADESELLAAVPEAQRHLVKPERGRRLQRSAALMGFVKRGYAEKQGIDLEHWEHLESEVNQKS